MINAQRLNGFVLVTARLLVLVVVVVLGSASCSNAVTGDDANEGAEPASAQRPDETLDSDQDPIELPADADDELMPAVPLPVRPGPRTETTYSVPHVQTSAAPVPEVDAELRRRIYSLPGLENRDTIVSLNGTTAMWLSADFEPADLAATMRDREFGHIHPDGSLHTVLPIERAREATSTKWAELHPWVAREDFWDGLVMLYTPQSFEELEVTWQLIVDSYNFVTGQDLAAKEFISE